MFVLVLFEKRQYMVMIEDDLGFDYHNHKTVVVQRIGSTAEVLVNIELSHAGNRCKLSSERQAWGR